MKKVICSMIVVVSVFVHGFAMAARNEPPSAPVTVVNTNSNPVPVSGAVTGSVSIDGIADVNVTNTVPVSGNVGITGTANVNVTNNEANPMPVSVVETIPQVIQITYTEDLPEPLLGPPDQVIYTVPAGFRLVIEYMEVRGSLYSGEAARGGISTMVNSRRSWHYIMTPPAMYLLSGAPLVNMRTSAGQMVRIYADPETDVVGQLSRTDGTGDASLALTINGYLQPVP